MRRGFHLLPILSLVLIALAPAIPALAAPYDNNPKLLLHARTHVVKNPCVIGSLIDCQGAVTEWDSGTPLAYVYVLAAKGSRPSVAAAQFGIRYQGGCPNNVLDQSGIDILGWTLCATLEFSSSVWPKPGGSNLITWDAVTSCQTGDYAVAGYFYVGIYGPDIIELIPRPVDDAAKQADCSAVETVLPVSALGAVRFSPGASQPGCNPCDGPCAPVGPIICMDPADTTAPFAIDDLIVFDTFQSTITLQWTVPLDNPGGSGLSHYLGRRSTSPITEANFDVATPLNMDPPGLPAPQTQVIHGLSSGTTYYFALKTQDFAGNVSPISNVAIGTTQSGPTGGATLDDARVLLHLGPVLANPAVRCGAGYVPNCADAVTAGGLAPAHYYAYLLVGRAGELGSVACGITYDGGLAVDQSDGDRIDVLSWTRCADLEFPTFSGSPWPAPMSGNLISWSSLMHCQVGPVAVAGYFYVGAYGDDEMRVIPRPIDGKASVTDCGSQQVELASEALGSVRFSTAGDVTGTNPCGDVTSIRPITWSRVKVLSSAGTSPR